MPGALGVLLFVPFPCLLSRKNMPFHLRKLSPRALRLRRVFQAIRGKNGKGKVHQDEIEAVYEDEQPFVAQVVPALPQQ